MTVLPAVVGTDRTTFVVTNVVEVARRVLADRTVFRLGARGLFECEAIDRRRSRDLPGRRRLMARPSPFAPYQHLVAEFEPSPTNYLHLFLLMKDIRRALAGTGPCASCRAPDARLRPAGRRSSRQAASQRDRMRTVRPHDAETMKLPEVASVFSSTERLFRWTAHGTLYNDLRTLGYGAF